MLALLLAACSHEGGALIFSNLVLGAGETGTVTLNAAEMGQFNSLQVGPKGRITYDPAVIHVLNVEGASGFIVFASDVNNLTGEISLAAGSTSGAVPNGPVIALTVRAVGAPGDSTSMNITQLDFVVKTNDDPIPGVSVTAGQITIN